MFKNIFVQMALVGLVAMGLYHSIDYGEAVMKRSEETRLGAVLYSDHKVLENDDVEKVMTNNKKYIVGFEINEPEIEIGDITEALIYAESFLYEDAKLVHTEGKSEGCGFNYCTIDYHLTYETEEYKQLTNNRDGKITVYIRFMYHPDTPTDIELHTVKIH